MRTHDGAFAPFAAQIARSRLYVGYDSAGGHVASACGVPLISIAKGFASDTDAGALEAHRNMVIRGCNALRRIAARTGQPVPRPLAHMYIPPLTSSTCPVM